LWEIAIERDQIPSKYHIFGYIQEDQRIIAKREMIFVNAGILYDRYLTKNDAVLLSLNESLSTITIKSIAMGYYENIKCGKCKHSFTGGYVKSNGFLKTYMGVPYVKCSNCGSVNRTSYKPYSTFHKIEKVYHWFSIVFRYTFWGVIFGFVVAVALHKFVLKDSNYLDATSYSIIVLIVIGMNIYAIRSERREIREVEEAYEAMT